MARYRGPAFWVVCCWGGESLGGRGTGHRPPYEPTGEPFRPGLSTHPSSISVCLEISGCACIYRATKHINIAQMYRFSRFAWPKRLPLETCFMGLCANREHGPPLCSSLSSGPPRGPAGTTQSCRQPYECNEGACHWSWWSTEKGIWVNQWAHVGVLGRQALPPFAFATSSGTLYSHPCHQAGAGQRSGKYHRGVPVWHSQAWGGRGLVADLHVE